MANLHATIVVRSKTEGKRSWVKANGKTDPAGSYYLRYCSGSTPRYVKAGESYDEAEMAQMRLERKLKAQSQGFVVPEEIVGEKSHRISEVIAAYLDDLRDNRRPERSIRSKESELRRFAAFAKKLLYVEEIKRADLIAYRNFLFDEGKAQVTVLNNIMSVVTWLKKNPVVSITRLLKQEDWPEKPDTEPRPYTQEEQEAMLTVATPIERLLLRLFLATGMREQEIAHAEASDLLLTPKGKPYIKVQDKPKYAWKPKTDAGRRNIRLTLTLYHDLKAHCSEGLLFPNPTTGRPEGHFLRIIQAIAKRAEVEGAGCHRFRDTYATEQVRARKLDLRDVAKNMGHENLEMMRLYAAYVDMDSEEADQAANVSDKFGAKPGPQLVKVG